MNGASLVLIFILVLLSSTSLFGHSWYNSTCSCRCEAIHENVVLCNISKNSSEGTSCSEVDPKTINLQINCLKFAGCSPLVFEKIFRYFLTLRNLKIVACQLNASSYEIIRQNSSVNWDVSFDRKPNTLASFALFFRLKARWMYFKNTTPPCHLTHLTIQDTILYVFPLGLILKCHLLEQLNLERNDLTLLDTLDLASIISRPHLWLLNLNSNALELIASELIPSTMKQVHTVLHCQLPEWIKKNCNKTLQYCESLTRLQNIFTGWGNKSSPLYFNDLMNYLRDTDVEIDLIYVNSSLSNLSLSGNSLLHIPDALAGFSNLTALDINHNTLESVFDRFERFAWFPIRNSLRNLSLLSNWISDIREDSFEFLDNVESLNLRKNGLHHFSRRAFNNNSKIQWLDLSQNLLTIFHLEKSYVLPRLTYLDLSHNRIISLTSSLSRAIFNIVTLDLSFNSMTTVAPFSLNNLKHLKLLDLGNGRLEDLPATNLKTNLRINEEDRVIVNFNNDGNPTINCDCFSVFPKLLKELDKRRNFSYPKFVLSNKTQCKQFNNTAGGFHIKDHKYHCVFESSYRFSSTEHTNHTINLSCPLRCKCVFKNPYDWPLPIHLLVDCSNQNLTFIPEIKQSIFFIPVNFKLNKNRIQTISMNMLSFGSLKRLDLSYNSLTFLISDVFKNLTNLITLDISHNPIYFIDTKSFVGLTSLKILTLKNLQLKVITSKPYKSEVLKNLKILSLSTEITSQCLCKDMLGFRTECKATKIQFSGKCYLTDDGKVQNIDAAERVCQIIEEQDSKRLQTVLFKAGLVIFSFGVACFTVSVFMYADVLLRFYVFLDASVKSTFARKILRLSTCNDRCQIDTVIFAHERQTGEVRSLLQRLANSNRRQLVFVRMAARLPGATPLVRIAEIAQNTATFVVFLSKDLLDDERTRDALRRLLTECRGPRIIPVLFSNGIFEHQFWPSFAFRLRKWRMLAWHEPTFWMRFLPSLPASKNSRREAFRLPQILQRSQPRIRSIADLCVVAVEKEMEAAKRLVDHYCDSLRLCFLCKNNLYGVETQEHLGRQLQKILALCPQVLVLVSKDFLKESWNQRKLVPALKKRLEAMTFRGSVILVEMSLEVPLMCRSETFRFYDELRKQTAAVTLGWPAIEVDWSALTQLLIAIPEKEISEEMEFDNMLRMPHMKLEED